MSNSAIAIEHFPSPAINLLAVMVLIWSTGVLFRKIKLPPILGELLAGIIFGPAFLGIIAPDSTLDVLSELGIFFIMFYAGLETNAGDLRKATSLSVPVGMGGFFVPLTGGYIVCKFIFGYDHITSIFIGLGLSITAIAISARVLTDMGMQSYRVAPVTMGAAIIDDVLSLAAISIIIGYVANGASFGALQVLFILLKLGAFFALAVFVGLKIFPRLTGYFSTREARGFTFALIVALSFGIMAELVGLHLIIGAYLAGVFIKKAIASDELFLKMEDRFVSVTFGFLGPIFIMSLSFHVTFSIFREHPLQVITLVMLATLGKVLGAGICAYLRGMTIKESAIVATAMNGRGAVELIIASLGLKYGLINDTVFSILVVMAFFTTLITPISLSIILRKSGTSGLVHVESN